MNIPTELTPRWRRWHEADGCSGAARRRYVCCGGRVACWRRAPRPLLPGWLRLGEDHRYHAEGPLDLAGSDASCPGPPEAPPPLDPTIHTLCNSVLLVTWHLLFSPSWRGVLLCCSPEGFFTFFPPLKCFFFYSLGVVPDPMWEVKGQGCRMCTECKALWGKFVIF